MLGLPVQSLVRILEVPFNMLDGMMITLSCFAFWNMLMGRRTLVDYAAKHVADVEEMITTEPSITNILLQMLDRRPIRPSAEGGFSRRLRI